MLQSLQLCSFRLPILFFAIINSFLDKMLILWKGSSSQKQRWIGSSISGLVFDHGWNRKMFVLKVICQLIVKNSSQLKFKVK